MQAFVNITKNEKLIIELLKKANWDLNTAVEVYYSAGHGEKASVSKSNPKLIEQTYAKYADPKAGKIEVEGLMKFYSDLGIDAESDTITLLISYYMKAQTNGEYSLEEFKSGFQAIGVQTIQDLKAKLPTLRTQWTDPSKFKEVYKWMFEFFTDKGFKSISMETAVGLWEMVLSDKCKFLKDWIEFLQTEKKDQIAVSKDTWVMTLELIEQTRGDFSNFVDDGAWPSMIDQFNEFYSAKYKQQ